MFAFSLSVREQRSTEESEEDRGRRFGVVSGRSGRSVRDSIAVAPRADGILQKQFKKNTPRNVTRR